MSVLDARGSGCLAGLALIMLAVGVALIAWLVKET